MAFGTHNVDVLVEAGFGFDPFTTVSSWTDISKYVHKFTTTRGGAATVTPRAVAGKMKLSLDNDDGRFDPANTSSTYNPDVKLSVPIRVRVIYNSITYPLYYGYTTGWKVSYPHTGFRSIVEVTCVDGLQLLNQKVLSITAGDALLGGGSGDQTGGRLTDVLFVYGWSSALQGTFDTGLATLRPWSAGVDEVTFLAYVNSVVASEPGFAFVGADGKFEFHSRIHHAGGSTSLYTFGPADLSYASVSTLFDDLYLFNNVTIDGEDFVQQETTDAASVTTHRSRSLALQGLHANGNQALNSAEWYKDRFKDMETRIDSFTVKPQNDPANLWPAVFTLDLRDAITVKTDPKGGGDALSQLVVMSQIKHVVTLDKWTVTYKCGPLTTIETNDYWILDTSKLDTETVLA